MWWCTLEHEITLLFDFDCRVFTHCCSLFSCHAFCLASLSIETQEALMQSYQWTCICVAPKWAPGFDSSFCVHLIVPFHRVFPHLKLRPFKKCFIINFCIMQPRSLAVLFSVQIQNIDIIPRKGSESWLAWCSSNQVFLHSQCQKISTQVSSVLRQSKHLGQSNQLLMCVEPFRSRSCVTWLLSIIICRVYRSRTLPFHPGLVWACRSSYNT
jgi:hypothetical protein